VKVALRFLLSPRWARLTSTMTLITRIRNELHGIMLWSTQHNERCSTWRRKGDFALSDEEFFHRSKVKDARRVDSSTAFSAEEMATMMAIENRLRGGYNSHGAGGVGWVYQETITLTIAPKVPCYGC
jgi:hypothetical protein